jgi:hypothetical protein
MTRPECDAERNGALDQRMSDRWPYKDGRTLTRWLTGLLAVFAAASVAALVFDIGHALMMQIALTGDLTLMRFVYNDLTSAVVTSWVFLFAFLATAAVFTAWIWRMHANSRALKDARIGPGMALAFYVIPVVNLWKPYRSMRGLWPAGSAARPELLLACWWAMWLLLQAAICVAIWLAVWAPDIEALRNGRIASAISDLAAIVGSLAAIVLINKVYKLHAHTAEAVLTRAFD